ncbi:MAG: hypothetical protein GX202_00075 [Firmicutes bacterium]|nr:hypothetical protein [Bacillota bacterium]
MTMKALLRILSVYLLVAVVLSGCGWEQDSFVYQGILFEGFDPAKHQPSPEFLNNVSPTKVLLSPRQIKALKKCVDLLSENNLHYLLEYPDRFVIVKAPYSFADKPQMIVYLDMEKVNLTFSIDDDWENKLLNANLGLMEDSGDFYFQGTPKLPNLLRILIHEIGHLVEFERLKFNWQGKFVPNPLNKEFVNISWDQDRFWQDKEGFSQKLHNIQSIEGLLQFLQWFKEESSFFSLSSSMGMNEDFAEAFVYYILKEYYDYEISFVYQGRVVLDNLQAPNRYRQQKMAFVANLMQNELLKNK